MSDIARRIAELSPEKRALLKMRLREESDASRASTTESIAVIGIGCRFPRGANSPQAFWELLRDGVDAISEVPAQRWDCEALYDPDPTAAGKMSTRWGGFLDRVDCFDNEFFGITPREASQMDPQQRLLLEVASEALEDSGQTSERMRGSATGVFIGIATLDYSFLQTADKNSIDAYTSSGSALSIAANRLSYMFDLKGPSIAIDTACSSSLVAVHLACQSLRNRECHAALAGGVNVVLSPLWTISLSKWGMMAADGRCKTFDSRADGFVRGEGCGVIVLKRLADAQAEGDNVLAVIRGTAINQDGRSTGLTAPHGPSQEAVIRMALDAARVSPRQITYVEAHGTGTALGDPIEIEALASVLGEPRENGETCLIGSVKTNIGHLEAAAGIAGLIKTVLALRHGAVPPNLHFRRLNPHISLDGTPFVIPTRLHEWAAPAAGPRYAGVSSFGFGGTNAHVILEEARSEATPQPPTHAEEGRTHILPLSARHDESLRLLARSYLEHFENEAVGCVPADVCYSASVRRTHHECRLALVARTREEMVKHLAAFCAGEERHGVAAGRSAGHRRQGAVFAFSGQGSQWHGMGRELWEREPVFRSSLEKCAEALREYAGWSLLSELLADESSVLLKRTEFAQPAIFAIQVGLAELWRSWGIEPGAVVGHSMGEVTAAHVAGSLSLIEAMKIICARARLMQRVSGKGEMAAVRLGAAEVERVLKSYEGRLSIAAVNSPQSVVLSGETEALGEVLRLLEERGDFVRPLEVNYAFHSPQMMALEGELVEAVRDLRPRTPSVPIFSTVTGQEIDALALDAGYWGRNMTERVCFAAAIDALTDAGFDTFIEIGPRPVLAGDIKECLRRQQREGIVTASMRRDTEQQAEMLRSLGTLYAAGYPVEWSRVYAKRGRLVGLPSYPWRQTRCWIGSHDEDIDGARHKSTEVNDDSTKHPFLRRHVSLAHEAGSHLWLIEIDRLQCSYLNDHRIQQAVVLPGTAYAEMVLAATSAVFGEGPRILKEVEFHKALFLTESGPSQVLQLLLSSTSDAEAAFRLYSRAAGGVPEGATVETGEGWTLHVTGKVSNGELSTQVLVNSELEEIRSRCVEELNGADFYALMNEKGNQWGPSFQGVRRLWKGVGEVLGEIVVPKELYSQLAAYQMHPALADACGQVLAVAKDFGDDRSENRGAFMGGGLDEIRFHKRPAGRRFWSHVRVRHGTEAGADLLEGDARVFDESGELVVEFVGIRFRYLEQGTHARVAQHPGEWFYEFEWQPKGLVEGRSFSTPEEHSASGGWLIFADRNGVGEALAEELAIRGVPYVLAFHDASFRRIDDCRYSLCSDDPEEFRLLLQTIFPRERAGWRYIVHLWSLDAPEGDDFAPDALIDSQNLGPASVLCMLHELARLDDGALPRLWLVTRGAQAVGGEPRRAPAVAQATLWGLGRTIAQEHAAQWGALIDLDPDFSAQEACAALLEGILHGGDEDQLAFRKDVRYVARLVRQRPQHASGRTPFKWRCDGCYLITGGLGDLGLHVARWMVEQGARRLVLIGRTALPARAEWSAVAEGTPVAARIAAVKQLEALGASVHLAALDVADEAQMSAFLHAFRREGWPPVRGVVHAAGVMDYRTLSETSPAQLHAVLRPKLLGAWLLHRLLEDMPLDFFLLFSSMSALLSSPLLGSYAAANAFLDALAHLRLAKELPALSINWGAWEGIGMAARNHTSKAAQTTPREMPTLTPRQGLIALEYLLRQCTGAQAGMMLIDWQQWRQHYPVFAGTPLLADLMRETRDASRLDIAVNGKSALSRESLLAAEPPARSSLLESFVRGQVEAVMGIPSNALDVQRPLSDMGLDSLMAIELKNRLESSLKVMLPMVQLLQGPSIRTLAALLLAQTTASSDLIGRGAAMVENDKTVDGWEILRI